MLRTEDPAKRHARRRPDAIDRVAKLAVHRGRIAHQPDPLAFEPATTEQAVDAESDAHRFLVASTSRAGRRSPVRLIIRGARRYTRSNPRPVYRRTIRSVA